MTMNNVPATSLRMVSWCSACAGATVNRSLKPPSSNRPFCLSFFRVGNGGALVRGRYHTIHPAGESPCPHSGCLESPPPSSLRKMPAWLFPIEGHRPFSAKFANPICLRRDSPGRSSRQIRLPGGKGRCLPSGSRHNGCIEWQRRNMLTGGPKGNSICGGGLQ